MVIVAAVTAPLPDLLRTSHNQAPDNASDVMFPASTPLSPSKASNVYTQRHCVFNCIHETPLHFIVPPQWKIINYVQVYDCLDVMFRCKVANRSKKLVSSFKV
ncbi:hypothetical protein CBL_05705 [Carabus blaptoides fortunei]